MRQAVYNRGVTINGKHTYRDYNMILSTTNPIGQPEPYFVYVDVPYGQRIDLTETFGGIKYKPRTITIELGAKRNINDWPPFLSQLYNDIHGKKVNLIFDDDKGHYYTGRLKIESFERALEIGTVTVSGEVDPYKYETTTSTDEWLWDTFNFANGIIRVYHNLQVAGSTEYTVIGTNRIIVPEITCSAAMYVAVNGVQYNLAAGINNNTSIRVLPGNNRFIFNGSGTATIKFRGCSL